MNIFFEIHQDLPREGPGDDESAAKAFELLVDLPSIPRILDAGCGPGMQTLQLAKISLGQILAIDTHLPFLKMLAHQARESGLAHQIHPLKMSMDSVSVRDKWWNKASSLSRIIFLVTRTELFLRERKRGTLKEAQDHEKVYHLVDRRRAHGIGNNVGKRQSGGTKTDPCAYLVESRQ